MMIGLAIVVGFVLAVAAVVHVFQWSDREAPEVVPAPKVRAQPPAPPSAAPSDGPYRTAKIIPFPTRAAAPIKEPEVPSHNCYPGGCFSNRPDYSTGDTNKTGDQK